MIIIFIYFVVVRIIVKELANEMVVDLISGNVYCSQGLFFNIPLCILPCDGFFSENNFLSSRMFFNYYIIFDAVLCCKRFIQMCSYEKKSHQEKKSLARFVFMEEYSNCRSLELNKWSAAECQI